MPDTAPAGPRVYITVGDEATPTLVGWLVRHPGESVPQALAGLLRAIADRIEKIPEEP